MLVPLQSRLLAAAGIAVLLASYVMAASPVSVGQVETPRSLRPVDVDMEPLLLADWIARDIRYAAARPIGATPGQSDTAVNQHGVTAVQDASGGCDGVKNGRWGFHVASGEANPWWRVDLGEVCSLDRIVIYNRLDRNAAGRTSRLEVWVAETSNAEAFTRIYRHAGATFGGFRPQAAADPLVVSFGDAPCRARYVELRVPGPCSFALDEVEVYAADDPTRNIALMKAADQSSVSKYSYPGTLPEGTDTAVPPGFTADKTDDPRADFSIGHIGDVLDRAERLAKRLEPIADPAKLESLVQELNELKNAVEVGKEPLPREKRRSHYLGACRLARRIAFCNPLLNIDRLLFLKRHDSVGEFHMCDQYYGFNAKPGGGLFILEAPFTAHPRLYNLLEDSVVERGRMAGRRLEGGTFLSPEVSYDGRTILFAYTEAVGEFNEWSPRASYHLFKIDADGRGLEQLTDGPWNDFDPCYLPSGRVVFVSERRGGFLRCGRHCPVYTMFWMEPDGSDILPLSFHETHEWHPSVDNNGMVVYSRWDYVDRDTNVAHHIWHCYPDGRDPRSFHGNYPVRRESRPWMEQSIRAIPGSNRYVAVTGAHHGHAFGSLVLIDPRIEDDGAMSQLERLTPEVPFPEGEGGRSNIRRHMIYGTPWPLSEDDYLCVYDAEAANRGVYWLDRDGNRELIYRDPEISCLSPMPLAARPVPPVIPSQTLQAARDVAASSLDPNDVTPTVAVTNIYDSDFTWPAGTKIDALRIIQLLPKSTAPPNEPRIGVANQTNARAVLGTVPVEEDGSAYFEAPEGVPLYFQALDADGLAVQSMRSATYLHPGERLACQGCHERKHGPPHRSTRVPRALRRPPSPIEPDVEGSRPFSYVRLVQPVLDRKCVDCHVKENALDLRGVMEGPHGWTRSYTNLAGKYGFYFHVSNGSIKDPVHGGSRTTPGEFGARASRLLEYLDRRHYGVHLSAEDRHRITLWLDCNSEFYGSYENTQAQSQGEVVWPTLE